jgi:putative membrane protein
MTRNHQGDSYMAIRRILKWLILQMKRKKEFLYVALKGLGMGAAEFVPGLSGATIALISGIYKEILDSIVKLNAHSIGLFFRQGFRVFWKSINGNFMLSLSIGILASLLSFSFLFYYLTTNFPIFTYSFVFGIITASIIYIFKSFKKWNVQIVLFLLLGIGINILLSFLDPMSMAREFNITMVIIAAILAGLVVYLPGISVALVLILIGQYEFIMKSISAFDFRIIFIYYGVSIIVFIAFSRIFGFFIKKFVNCGMALMTGFMIGSLYKIWPWKQKLLAHVTQYAKEIPIKVENVLPNSYFELTGKDPYTLYAILLAITGFLTVYLLHHTFSPKTDSGEQMF